ncbi:hypothetical protein AVEN_23079-1 [Araneus ventricosus]|uniref:Uncharacterized protein n=1 Tax=Araneus ventricosus TaxID=182803 RepID=A0A4Y2JBI6_ARAVE|nr:hypothetical protein AVEN_23079-1 [Araneus ventricosus]
MAPLKTGAQGIYTPCAPGSLRPYIVYLTKTSEGSQSTRRRIDIDCSQNSLRMLSHCILSRLVVSRSFTSCKMRNCFQDNSCCIFDVYRIGSDLLKHLKKRMVINSKDDNVERAIIAVESLL